MRRLIAGAAVTALLPTLGCGDDSRGPTEPSTRPALATASTPLAFSQLSGTGFYTCGVTTGSKAYCWASTRTAS
jgi:hypothetical protein